MHAPQHAERKHHSDRYNDLPHDTGVRKHTHTHTHAHTHTRTRARTPMSVELMEMGGPELCCTYVSDAAPDRSCTARCSMLPTTTRYAIMHPLNWHARSQQR